MAKFRRPAGGAPRSATWALTTRKPTALSHRRLDPGGYAPSQNGDYVPSELPGPITAQAISGVVSVRQYHCPLSMYQKRTTHVLQNRTVLFVANSPALRR